MNKLPKEVFKTDKNSDNVKSKEVRDFLEKNNNSFVYKKIGVLHFTAGIFFLIDIGIFLETICNIRIQFESLFLRIIFFAVFPFLFGFVKVLIIDKFFDTLSYKIKWIFAIAVYFITGFIIWYFKTH